MFNNLDFTDPRETTGLNFSNELQNRVLMFLISQKPFGSIMSKNDVYDYARMTDGMAANELIYASRNYDFWLRIQCPELNLGEIKEFVLVEIETSKLPIVDIDLLKEEVKKEYRDLVEKYKALTQQTGMYPPLIYYEEENIILDGNHRAKALQELGYKMITVFKAIKR
ncbi:hypothetical protein LV84_00474 [Algoriphagus ratkowskyi]|uniref:ParB-like nuclease family protein n=1 Tax=Algoriphagus ratkowskyi TaxID=57028 RepID=A0A2W7RIH5_9BACT|nr:hypothetical protein [Algoriphagus ratkowskyi]PZX60204.1 hypothetical protein LV84_00474 [Algoriphagus ratkowskyi]TXD78030.1 hypothetical protein ESW18_08245 [Algoriphagus ratkowskyi]